MDLKLAIGCSRLLMTLVRITIFTIQDRENNQQVSSQPISC